MKTCKTCKFWGKNRNGSYQDDSNNRLKSCSSNKIKYGYSYGANGYYSDDDFVLDNGALIEDDEGWGMVTGKDFGCVLHEGS